MTHWHISLYQIAGMSYPVDNFGTVVGENPTPYGILALWAVNGLSVVYWDPYMNLVPIPLNYCAV